MKYFAIILVWVFSTLAIGIPIGKAFESLTGFLLALTTPFNVVAHIFLYKIFGAGQHLKKCGIYIAAYGALVLCIALAE